MADRVCPILFQILYEVNLMILIINPKTKIIGWLCISDITIQITITKRTKQMILIKFKGCKCCVDHRAVSTIFAAATTTSSLPFSSSITVSIIFAPST